jgi:hypothetical protein
MMLLAPYAYFGMWKERTAMAKKNTRVRLRNEKKRRGGHDDDESSGFTLPARFEIRSLFHSTNHVFFFLFPSRM